MTVQLVSPTTTAMPRPLLTVIVPCYNCAGMLTRCLDGLLASTLPRHEWELIVVDDRSTDETPEVARPVADQLIFTPPGPRGPGLARNHATEHARGEAMVFIDADVVVAPDALERFATIFRHQPDVAAVFGAYDTNPGDPGFVSQYRNLLHHWVHAQQAGDAQTFWAGCGAVRLDAFRAVGGFDGMRYQRPQIEDIELGYRLADKGYRILLDPSIQGQHLKTWTLHKMARADLLDRAVPWMSLLLDRREVAEPGPLNLSIKDKVLTAIMGVAVAMLALAVVTWHGEWLLVMLACLLAVALGNMPLFRWFAEIRGVRFAIGTVPLRLIFYLASGFGAAWSIVTHPFREPLPQKTPIRRSTDRTVAHFR